MWTWHVWLDREHGYLTAAEAALKAIVRGEFNLHACRVSVQISQDEVIQDILPSEPREIDALSPAERERRKRMKREVGSTVVQHSVDGEYVDIEFKTHAAVGTLSGVESQREYLCIVEGRPGAEPGFKRRRVLNR